LETANRNVLLPYKTNYLLFYTHDDAAPDDGRDMREAMYQFSIKIPLHYDRFDLAFAYSQKAFWQVYDGKDTRPFREIDHNPELFFTYETDEALPGLYAVSVGYEHESNGEALGENSRSWNRLNLAAHWKEEATTLCVKVWHWYKKPPKTTPEDPYGEETPGIENYYGNGEIALGYAHGAYRADVMVRHTLTDKNRGAAEIALSGPMRNLDWYVRYWNGYGESVGAYDRFSNRLGIGVRFTR
jgi:phospholipase A1